MSDERHGLCNHFAKNLIIHTCVAVWSVIPDLCVAMGLAGHQRTTTINECLAALATLAVFGAGKDREKE
ncbi:unnamed protein product [Dovyalis caffra]|uniref:Uncharacterized protein n=1 Tax=Dovyalis caffra TaxID=77055 RepID=A0AAV1R0Y2_9ROSI|nr:unnamed protein product [Dovyalis caffra]